MLYNALVLAWAHPFLRAWKYSTFTCFLGYASVGMQVHACHCFLTMSLFTVPWLSAMFIIWVGLHNRMIIVYNFKFIGCIAGKFLIADTNNSVIRCLNLNEKVPILGTLELKGVQPPSPRRELPKRLRRKASVDVQVIKIDGGSSGEGSLELRISVLEGYHFSKVWFLMLIDYLTRWIWSWAYFFFCRTLK